MVGVKVAKVEAGGNKLGWKRQWKKQLATNAQKLVKMGGNESGKVKYSTH